MPEPIGMQNAPLASGAPSHVFVMDGLGSAPRRYATALLSALLSSNRGPVKALRSQLFADLNWAVNTVGQVVADSDPFNGVYVKSGASGTGSWTRLGPLPSADLTDVYTTIADEVTRAVLAEAAETATRSANDIIGLALAKAYADSIALMAAALVPKGGKDVSANPNYPAATTGDFYFTTNSDGSKKIGGASGTVVANGDMIFCITTNAGGTQAAVGASWLVVSMGLSGAALLAAMNTFVGLQTIVNNTTGAAMVLESNNSGTTGSGPNFRSTRKRATAGELGGLTIYGQNGAAADTLLASVIGRLVSATTDHEYGELALRTTQDGSSASRLVLGAGVRTPLATGGDMGGGSANFERFYEDGISAEIAGLMRGYDVWYEDIPSILVGGATGDKYAVWCFRSRQEDTTPPTPPDTRTNATMGIVRAAKGIGADGPGNTDRTLIVTATRGEGNFYQDDTTLGQINGITIYHRVPQVSSHAPLLIDSRRITSALTGDLALSGSDDGGNSIIEANLNLYSPGLDGFDLLLQQGIFLGHTHVPTNGAYMAGDTTVLWAQMTISDAGDVGVGRPPHTSYCVVLVDENNPTTAGYRYSVAHHRTINDPPYFGITGYGDLDSAPGRVLAKRGISNSFPAYAFMADPNTGVDSPSADVLNLIAGGVVCGTAQKGAFTFPSYTVAVANALASPVVGSVIRISDHSGGATLAQYEAGFWKTITLGGTIS